MRDRTPPLDSPRRTLAVLVVGAAAYAAYRMIQTVLIGANYVEPGVSALERVVVAAADGGIMALSAPLAYWASRRFPLVPAPPIRNIVAHLVIAFAVGMAWIGGLTVVFAVVTGTPISNPFLPSAFAWLTSNLFAYSLLVAVVHLVTFQQRVREGELRAALLQSQLSTARLETLKAQLHPHFLFNTLHTISELIHMDPKAADAMVIRLGTLLRLSLDYTVEPEVALERELEVVGAYLDLHRMRHGDRLSAKIDVDPAVRRALVPPMILQPLVENSLRHGLNRRAPAGSIFITGQRVGDRLRLSVADNGVGLPAHVREGVGLTNTRTRLNQLYAGDHQFALTTREGGGAEAVVEIPIRFPPTRLEPVKVRPVYANGRDSAARRTM